MQAVVLYAYKTLGNSLGHMPFAPYPLKPSLDHFEQRSVCDFNLPVVLGVGKRGVIVLDPQLLAEISKCIIVELLAVVKDEDSRNSEVANDTFPDKAPDVLLCDSG